MIKRLLLAAALLISGAAYGANPTANLSVQIVPAGSAPAGSILPSGHTWTLVARDEFDGPTVNSSMWTHPADGAIVNGGDYINNTLAVSFSNGQMVMTEFPRPGGGENGGGEITSTAKYGHGYYETRIQPGTGWSLFWSLGDNFNCVGDLSQGFEADIYENISSGGQDNVHWGGYGSCHQSSGHQNLGVAPTAFVVVGMWYQTTGLTFYLNGVQTFNLPCNTPTGTGCDDVMNVKFTVAGLDGSVPFKVDWFRFFTTL
jgi:hypothetical protein